MTRFRNPEFIQGIFRMAAEGWGWIYRTCSPDLYGAASTDADVTLRVGADVVERLGYSWLPRDMRADLLGVLELEEGELLYLAALARERYPPYQNIKVENRSMEMATPKQVNFLRRLGYKGEIPTKANASILIDQLKNDIHNSGLTTLRRVHAGGGQRV
jgi:hypothetical protein